MHRSRPARARQSLSKSSSTGIELSVGVPMLEEVVVEADLVDRMIAVSVSA